MPFLLCESIKAKLFELNKISSNIDYAFFNNSEYIYRPIWTYLAEQANVNVIFYFIPLIIFNLVLVIIKIQNIISNMVGIIFLE